MDALVSLRGVCLRDAFRLRVYATADKTADRQGRGVYCLRTGCLGRKD